MINVIFSDNNKHLRFAPISLTKPIAKIKMGLLSFEERWLFFFDKKVNVFYQTENYLINKKNKKSELDLIINSTVIPSEKLFKEIINLKKNTKLVGKQGWIASRGYSNKHTENTNEKYLEINYLWDLFQKNDIVLNQDFDFLTKGRVSEKLNPTNTIIGSKIFVEKGASVNCSILNSSTGPIYIGKNAEIQEGAIIRGGLGLLKNATIKMGAKIYGATTIGAFSKVGGEISNSIIQGYTNKGHDGFLGNSLLGEWCNLGADTNTSNLKNNYSNINIYSFESKKTIKTNCQFLGLIMGDHSKCGINTMFNTGTIVGVCSNIFGGDFPPKYIPSFSWGGSKGFEKYNFIKAIETAKKVMKRRNVNLNDFEIQILNQISNQSDKLP